MTPRELGERVDADPEIRRAWAALEAGHEFWRPRVPIVLDCPGRPDLDALQLAYYGARAAAGRLIRGE